MKYELVYKKEGKKMKKYFSSAETAHDYADINKLKANFKNSNIKENEYKVYIIF